MNVKKLWLIGFTVLISVLILISCDSNNPETIIGGNDNGEPEIIDDGTIEAMVDGELWQGEITSHSFSIEGQQETITINAHRTNAPGVQEDDPVDKIVLKILSDEGELLYEREYSNPLFEVTLEEPVADLPDELWVSSSGTANVVEITDDKIQVKFNAVMRRHADLEQGITSGEMIFIEDGKLNESLSLDVDPGEEI